MSKHYIVLVAGSALFLAAIFSCIRALPVDAGFEPAALTGLCSLQSGLKLLAAYAVFLALVFGHRVLQERKMDQG